MVVGYCSLVQKGQTSGCSGCSHTVDTVHSGRSMQWIQSEVDAVDIVFDAKRSNQRMQWMQYAVDKWYMVVGYCSLVQKGQTRGCSGCSIQ